MADVMTFRKTPMPDHGTNARYQRGCRCDLCRRAAADYQSRWRHGKGHQQVIPIVACPTCGNPAYERPTGLQHAQPGRVTA